MSVINLLAGAMTKNSFIVKGRVQVADNTPIRLWVSTNSDYSSPTFFAISAHVDKIAHATATSLQPHTWYWYGFEIDGTRDLNVTGKVRTSFEEGVACPEIKFGASSCATNGSNNAVFTHIPQRGLDFFIHTGDLHYEDVGAGSKADPNQFLFWHKEAWDNTLNWIRSSETERNSPNQRNCWKSQGFVYVWDDHDYGPNNSGTQNPSKLEARQVYDEYHPHYPLPATTGEIYQSFVWGRVRFILTDLRYSRDVTGSAETRTLMSQEQEEWFKNECLEALKENQIICWVNTVPWITSEGEWQFPGWPDQNARFRDHWGSAHLQRQRFGQFFEEYDLGKIMFAVAGDMHGLALDNGEHNVYGGFPVFQFASLDRTPSVKGGPYTIGPVAKTQNYGVVTITDNDETITVHGAAWHLGAVNVETEESIANAPQVSGLNLMPNGEYPAEAVGTYELTFHVPMPPKVRRPDSTRQPVFRKTLSGWKRTSLLNNRYGFWK